MNKISKYTSYGLMAFVAMAFVAVATLPVDASAAPITWITPTNVAGPTNLVQTIGNIINVIIGILALVAVVMIVYGGVRYTTSGGSADSIKAAKNIILYAIIGLVVAALAFAVVTFVISQFGTSSVNS